MLSAKLLLIPAAVVGLLAFSHSKPASAASAKPGANATPPSDVMAKIAAAFQAADPAQCRKVADEVEAQGFKAQADDLRAFAAKVEAAIATTPPSKPPATATLPPSVPGGKPPAPVAVTPEQSGAPAITTLPEVVIQASGPTQAQRLLAGKTALMLRNVAKGKEDQVLVTAFQQQEQELGHGPGGTFGSAPSAADGKYGPKTALQLARHYAIVPPKPLYWSKLNWLTDKKNYRAELAHFAGADPQRADEWSRAGAVL